MELSLNINLLGKTQNIFGFYRYITQKLESHNSVLLESVSDDSKQMQFSFIGIEPEFMIKTIGKDINIYNVRSEKGEKFKAICESAEPFENENKLPFRDKTAAVFPAIQKLKTIFPITKSAMPELFPQKIFSGGLLGYIGYDVVAPYVGYTPSKQSQDEFPDVLMGLFSEVLAYSHTTQKIYKVSNNMGNEHPDQIIDHFFEKYKDNNKYHPIMENKKLKSILAQPNDFKTNTSESQWAQMIQKTKEHIDVGDIIQTVLSRKMIADSDIDPFYVYEALRYLNPSPYMYYLNFEKAHNGDIRIIGSSPESLITKNRENLDTVPIAGTRRRGKNKKDEEKMMQELLQSEKELAEHIMLVDLARNDLSRVSIPGSIETYKLIELKKFPNIMHLISKVRSKSYLDPFTILQSMFPAGTVSGAPKKRAMEIIHNLEQEDRGPYAGNVGYISFAGDMDMAISIRTLFNKDQKFIAQAGAGIVADSSAEEEYLETANKMRGILSTLKLAEDLEKGGL